VKASFAHPLWRVEMKGGRANFGLHPFVRRDGRGSCGLLASVRGGRGSCALQQEAFGQGGKGRLLEVGMLEEVVVAGSSYYLNQRDLNQKEGITNPRINYNDINLF
jgi:hypothetical protein